MSQYIQFGTAESLPDSGSIYPIGTAFLRSNPGVDVSSHAMIAVGHCESISIKATGEELDLEDEEGSTEAFIMMNNGEELTINARFTRNVPTPRKGNFIAIKRRRSSHNASIQEVGDYTDGTYVSTFLITSPGEDYGSKAVAKYSLTCKRWDSLGITSKVADVTTSTGAVTGVFGGVGAATPFPTPVGG